MKISSSIAVLAVAILFSAFICSSATAISKYNLRAGKVFLEQNANKEGVITTASGLQYKVLESGTGKVHPTNKDTVQVKYRGTTIKNKEFDSSTTPTEFGVTQVIPGWTEGLKLMVVGDKFEMYIPYDLAYGSQGAGGTIGPNSALIFTVELVGIKGK